MPICSEWWLLFGFSFQPFSYSGCPSHHYFMLQLTLIIFFLTFTVYVLSLVFFQKKLQRYFLSKVTFSPLLGITLSYPVYLVFLFLPHQTKSCFPFLGFFFSPLQLRVPFLITCKYFGSYLCSVHEDLNAHYFFLKQVS